MWSEVPTGAVGVGVVLLSMIALAKYLLGDRHVSDIQATEIRSLRDELNAVRERLVIVEQDSLDQHKQKHAAQNRLSNALLTLDVVHRLYVNCTCGALAPIGPILDDMSNRGQL